jgi:4-amino-4-deoxy-L-arabinose transferase-like glycosyltransferase
MMTASSLGPRPSALGPASLFLGSLLYRIPFRAHELFHGDSYGLACGVLYTLTAHPPGFIGYCALVRLVYLFAGDVNLSFVIVNIVSTAVATVLTYLVAKNFFDATTGTIAAVLYATSLDTSYFAEVALTYAAEGAFATGVALTGWLAIQRRSLRWLLAHAAVLAVGGSVRQTTLAFLFPLFLWVLWRAASRWRDRIAAFALMMVLVTAWSIPNGKRLTTYWDARAGSYFQTVYDLQVRMEQYYDSSAFGKVEYEQNAPRFHWPLVELVVAAWNAVDPPEPDAPHEIRAASATHALRMIRYQTAKLLFYAAVACGLATLFVLLTLQTRVRRTIDFERWMFLGLWILPSAFFFALNHLGAWGYLLIFLAALMTLAARAIVVLTKRPMLVTAFLAMVNILTFMLMRPLPDTTDRNRTINVALLQYGAPAIRMHYARSRAKAYTSDPRQLQSDCVTDECLVRDLPDAFDLPKDLRPVRPLSGR